MKIFQKIASIFQPPSDSHGQKAVIDNEKVLTDVREYSTLKQIMTGNTEHIRIKGSRVPSIDCNLMSILIQDVLRHKTIEKM